MYSDDDLCSCGTPMRDWRGKGLECWPCMVAAKMAGPDAAAPLGTPGAPKTNPLPSILSALDTAIDMASVRLGRLKESSSAWKTQRGVLRGLQEARDIIRANGGP